MTQKIINIFVGITAIALLVGGLLVLQNKKNSDKLASEAISTSVVASEQSSVLSDTTQNTSVSASIVSENILTDGNRELGVQVKILNSSGNVLQFSAGIDVSLLDKTSQMVYAVASSPSTTLFGGPINPGENTEGTVYFTVPSSSTQLELLYQPNNATTTQSVSL